MFYYELINAEKRMARDRREERVKLATRKPKAPKKHKPFIVVRKAEAQ